MWAELFSICWMNGSELFLVLLPIANPLGLAAAFLELTEGYTTRERSKLAMRVGRSCFFFLGAVLLIGYWVLSFFRISLPYISIAGGFLLLSSAWDMLVPRSRVTKEEREEFSNHPDEIAFVPLTTPIIAGPGTIAATLAATSGIETELAGAERWSAYLGALIGIAVLGALVAICFRFAEVTFTRLGRTGTNLISRISALILLSISIEMIWRGLSALIAAFYASQGWS